VREARANRRCRTITLTSTTETSTRTWTAVLRLTERHDVVYLEDEEGTIHDVVRLPPTHVFITLYRNPHTMESLLKYLKKAVPAAEAKANAALGKSKLMEVNPALAEFMTVTDWGEGQGTRETASLTIVLTETGWKASINDRDARRSCFATGNTPEAAIAALESRLQADEADWREWSPDWQKKTTKKGK